MGKIVRVPATRSRVVVNPKEKVVLKLPSAQFHSQDRLLLWRLNCTLKDGSLSSQEALQKWKLACQILARKGLIPEDGNFKENEKVFMAVIEPVHTVI